MPDLERVGTIAKTTMRTAGTTLAALAATGAVAAAVITARGQIRRVVRPHADTWRRIR